MDGVKCAFTPALWPCTFCSDPSGKNGPGIIGLVVESVHLGKNGPMGTFQ